MPKTKKIVGVPFGWAETGTEGFIWAVQEKKHISKDGQHWDYKGLHCIKPYDHLELYQLVDKQGNKLKKKHLLWSGKIIILKWSNGHMTLGGGYVHWIPDNVDLWQWAEVFMNENRRGQFEAVLRKVEK